MKKTIAWLLVITLGLAIFCVGCSDCGGSSSSKDPDVAAYDEWWIRNHNLDGSQDDRRK